MDRPVVWICPTCQSDNRDIRTSYVLCVHCGHTYEKVPTREEAFLQGLRGLCRRHKVELTADPDDEAITVWNVPHEVDLGHNDKPKEYPWFKLHDVGPRGWNKL